MKIIPNIAVSTQKIKAFLYEKHRLPVQYAKDQKGQKKPSANVVAIRRLMEAFPGLTELQTVGKLVLRHRRVMKKAADLKDGRVEADGRVYAIFKQDTLLGRLSSSATPKKEGQNLQNVDHELRVFYLPDTGDERPR
jgi:DNA polymerase I-like protein with 3'-5' exonuclease and polymerase domains